jgi:hypothetical protein
MPRDHRRRLDDGEGLGAARPDPRKHDPESAVQRRRMRFCPPQASLIRSVRGAAGRLRGAGLRSVANKTPARRFCDIATQWPATSRRAEAEPIKHRQIRVRSPAPTARRATGLEQAHPLQGPFGGC